MTAYKDDLGALLAFLTQAIPAKYLPMAQAIASDIDYFLGPLGQEMQGIASASGFELGQIVLLNYLYELTAYCTSILAVTPDGQLVHGRNLDYGLPFDLQRVTINAQFVQTINGTVTNVFQATTFAGYVGVLTGMSPQLSVTVDEWDTGSILENGFAAIFEGGKSSAMLIREILQSNMAYEDAVTTLARTSLIAPVFLIVGGVGSLQATVITRDRYIDANIWQIDANAGVWYLVQTNYPNWLPDPTTDPRRTYAENHLNAIGQASLDYVSLLDVISTAPVLNNGTIYSIVMSVSSGEFVSWVR